jgi:hypothetical protein
VVEASGKKGGGWARDTRHSDVTLLRDSNSTGVTGSLLGVGPAYPDAAAAAAEGHPAGNPGDMEGHQAIAMQALLKLKYTVGRNKEVLLLDDDPSEGHTVRVEDVRFLTGFVPQDDLLHDTLTVRLGRGKGGGVGVLYGCVRLGVGEGRAWLMRKGVHNVGNRFCSCCRGK